MTIETCSDVHAWFHERLTAVLSRQDVRLAAPTEVYLVHLLSDYAGRHATEVLERPLVEQLAEASEARGSERLRKLRDLGNTALYVSGFFSDHLDRRGVSQSYVATMGERAFLGCGAMVRVMPADGPELVTVYDELGHRFERVVQVLDDVRESTALRTPQDIVRLYEKWKQTRSPVLAARLQAQGVFPVIDAHTKRTVH